MSAVILVAGCQNAASNEGDTDAETVVDSGFAPVEDDDAGTPTGGSANSANSETGGLGEGDLRGTLSFTLVAADAANETPVLGLAGAWRVEGDELAGVEDFFGVVGLGVQYPVPPPEADSLEQNAVPPTFEWGGPTQWQLAGNAMKLQHGDAEALACLLYYGGSPEVEFPPGSGTLVPNYPIYATTLSSNQPDGCLADPRAWVPNAAYDIVLYGGDLFATNALRELVHTPDRLEVTSPDITTFGLPVSLDEDLDVTWTGAPGDGTRLVLRVADMFGRMFTVRAEDDGHYTIGAAELAALTPGPATLTVARENLETIPFTHGTVDVLSRYEQRAYLELY